MQGSCPLPSSGLSRFRCDFESHTTRAGVVCVCVLPYPQDSALSYLFK